MTPAELAVLCDKVLEVMAPRDAAVVLMALKHPEAVEALVKRPVHLPCVCGAYHPGDWEEDYHVDWGLRLHSRDCPVMEALFELKDPRFEKELEFQQYYAKNFCEQEMRQRQVAAEEEAINQDVRSRRAVHPHVLAGRSAGLGEEELEDIYYAYEAED